MGFLDFGGGYYWIWLVGGLALCTLELAAPGTFLIWIGLAAMMMGALAYFVPMAAAVQALSFAALVAGLIFLGRRVYGSADRTSPPSPLSRAHGLIGKIFVLDAAIENGIGRIRVDDSVWRVTGQDMPNGARVRVAGVEDGSLLRVETT